MLCVPARSPISYLVYDLGYFFPSVDSCMFVCVFTSSGASPLKVFVSSYTWRSPR